jgi:hypothetical protein
LGSQQNDGLFEKEGLGERQGFFAEKAEKGDEKQLFRRRITRRKGQAETDPLSDQRVFAFLEGMESHKRSKRGFEHILCISWSWLIR